MSEHITITHERTDDIPAIIAFLLKMRVAELIDKHFPTNGNWTGLSLGQMLVVWLTFIISEGDIGSLTLSRGSQRINTRSVALCTKRCCHAIAPMIGWRRAWIT